MMLSLMIQKITNSKHLTKLITGKQFCIRCSQEKDMKKPANYMCCNILLIKIYYISYSNAFRLVRSGHS